MRQLTMLIAGLCIALSAARTASGNDIVQKQEHKCAIALTSTIFIACPDGMVPTGGGFQKDSGAEAAEMLSSYPDFDRQTTNDPADLGWRVELSQTQGCGTVYVLCVRAGAVAGDADCEPGRYGTVGSSECQQCEPGRFNGDGVVCEDCPTGSYASGSGATECTPCEVGRFASTSGGSGCEDCPAGKFASSTGGSGCEYCPSGKFAAGAGSVECAECGGAGRFAPAGSTQCQTTTQPTPTPCPHRCADGTCVSLQALCLLHP